MIISTTDYYADQDCPELSNMDGFTIIVPKDADPFLNDPDYQFAYGYEV